MAGRKEERKGEERQDREVGAGVNGYTYHEHYEAQGSINGRSRLRVYRQDTSTGQTTIQRPASMGCAGSARYTDNAG